MNILKEKTYKSGMWLFLIMFSVFIAGSLIISLFFYKEFALYHELADILIPCLLYLLITRQPVLRTLRLDKGLNKQNVLRIFQLFLVSFLIKYGVNYLATIFTGVDTGAVTMKVLEMVPDLFIFFIAVAVIPVFLEEILVRGVILDRFRDTNLLQSAVITGLMFGFMHLDPGQLGYATALGIMIACIVLVTGSLWGGILFHFFNNFTSFAVLAVFKILAKYYPEIFDLSLGSDIIPAETGLVDQALMIVIAVIVLVVGIYMTVHFIKKMIRENDYQDVKSEVTWKELIINVPMALTVTLYVVLILLV
ncbi:MAG: CPBP family intramembrane metalloprotease [Eubacteriaceae bacterium]|nr:CPBP family intramembrane metalloprotease [Eubacteriaceae bacterium]